MEELYVVHGQGSIVAIVKGNSEEEALYKFAENHYMDDTFQEHVNNFAINMSFLETFFKDEYGDSMLYNDDLTDEEKTVNVERNVRDFYRDYPHLGEEYIEQLNNQNRNRNYGQVFSKEFYIQTFILVVNQGDWYDDFEITEIDQMKEYQVIFND